MTRWSVDFSRHRAAEDDSDFLVSWSLTSTNHPIGDSSVKNKGGVVGDEYLQFFFIFKTTKTKNKLLGCTLKFSFICYSLLFKSILKSLLLVLYGKTHILSVINVSPTRDLFLTKLLKYYVNEYLWHIQRDVQKWVTLKCC